MAHDNAPVGMLLLRFHKLADAAVGTFQTGPELNHFRVLSRQASVKAGSVGKCFQRRVGLRQVFGDFGFDAAFHGYPVRYGGSGVDKDGVLTKTKRQRDY